MPACGVAVDEDICRLATLEASLDLPATRVNQLACNIFPLCTEMG
jgi:hypothetical protein